MEQQGPRPGAGRDRSVLQLVGLARRAGFAVVGTQAVRDAARRGELSVVVVAEDATENARKRLRVLLHHGQASILSDTGSPQSAHGKRSVRILP